MLNSFFGCAARAPAFGAIAALTCMISACGNTVNKVSTTDTIVTSTQQLYRGAFGLPAATQQALLRHIGGMTPGAWNHAALAISARTFRIDGNLRHFTATELSLPQSAATVGHLRDLLPNGGESETLTSALGITEAQFDALVRGPAKPAASEHSLSLAKISNGRSGSDCAVPNPTLNPADAGVIQDAAYSTYQGSDGNGRVQFTVDDQDNCRYHVFIDNGKTSCMVYQKGLCRQATGGFKDQILGAVAAGRDAAHASEQQALALKISLAENIPLGIALGHYGDPSTLLEQQP